MLLKKASWEPGVALRGLERSRVTCMLLLLQALSSQPKQSHVNDFEENGYLRERVESGLEMKYLVPLRGKEGGRAWREAPSAG